MECSSILKYSDHVWKIGTRVIRIIRSNSDSEKENQEPCVPFEPADSILPANRGTLKSEKSFKLSSHLDIFENALSGWGSPAASAKVFLFLLQGASLVRLTHVNTDFSMIWSCFQNYLVRRSHLVASPCKCCP